MSQFFQEGGYLKDEQERLDRLREMDPEEIIAEGIRYNTRSRRRIFDRMDAKMEDVGNPPKIAAEEWLTMTPEEQLAALTDPNADTNTDPGTIVLEAIGGLIMIIGIVWFLVAL